MVLAADRLELYREFDLLNGITTGNLQGAFENAKPKTSIGHDHVEPDVRARHAGFFHFYFLQAASALHERLQGEGRARKSWPPARCRQHDRARSQGGHSQASGN